MGISSGRRNTECRYVYTLVIRVPDKSTLNGENFSYVQCCQVLYWVCNKRRFKLNASSRYTLMGASLMQIIFITAFVTISDLVIFIFKNRFPFMLLPVRQVVWVHFTFQDKYILCHVCIELLLPLYICLECIITSRQTCHILFRKTCRGSNIKVYIKVDIQKIPTTMS